jgi:hypothetical protein
MPVIPNRIWWDETPDEPKQFGRSLAKPRKSIAYFLGQSFIGVRLGVAKQ